jgi:predicted nucleic acid-binding protein
MLAKMSSKNQITIPKFLIYNEILPWFQTVEVKKIEAIVLDDPSDDKFIACAIEGLADAMVSGDRHLLDFGSFNSIQIITPTQLLFKETS